MNKPGRTAVDAHKRFRETPVFGSLDGLRCLSILAVIWHHTGGHSFDIALSGQGRHGVTLFFAISGFLITTLLLREQDKLGYVSLKKFYARRSLRIFPLYYSVLLLYIIGVLITDQGDEYERQFWSNLPAFATYTSNWFVTLDSERVIFYFAWSLATEEQFYLTWPWIQKHLRSWGPVIFMSTLLAVMFIVSHGLLELQEGPLLTVLQSLMPGLCLGAILANLLHYKTTFDVIYRAFGNKFSSLLWLAVFIGYLTNHDTNEWLVHTLGALLVCSCVVREDHCLKPVFQCRPVAWIGMISYGMYMLHMLCKNGYDLLMPAPHAANISAAAGLHPAIMQFIGTTLITVFVASLSFKYFESFFLRLKAKYDTVSKDPR